ncbi:MAG: hemolysin family protein [Rhodospirillaceae bacterium]|nr:hemolysin family protein [Rhodospirillaceae bacterium]
MRALKRWLVPKTEDAEAVRDVIEELIEERIEESPEGDAAIDPNERLLLSNVLALRDITARDIMVPRADIVAIEASTPLTEALQVLTSGGHSRLPVFRDTLDEILGLIHIKDLAIFAIEHSLPADATHAPPQKRTLLDMVRSVLFISPAVRVLDLLLEMRLKRTHMALVVDEYGGIDGLLTIEDVVEQIVGEIEDEHDTDEAPQLRDGPDGTLFADARLALADFEARVGKVFSDEEREQADTLGGLVISIAGRVPGRGALVRHDSGIEFEVIDSDPRRVRQLRIRNLPATPSAK